MAWADANADVTLVAKGTCTNGSALMVLTNASGVSGVQVNIAQNMTMAGKSTPSKFKVMLAPGESRNLGCTTQDSPPATNVQFAWTSEGAQYQ